MCRKPYVHVRICNTLSERLSTNNLVSHVASFYQYLMFIWKIYLCSKVIWTSCSKHSRTLKYKEENRIGLWKIQTHLQNQTPTLKSNLLLLNSNYLINSIGYFSYFYLKLLAKTIITHDHKKNARDREENLIKLRRLRCKKGLNLTKTATHKEDNEI